VYEEIGHFPKFRPFKSQKQKKKRSPSVLRTCSPRNCYYLMRFSDKKGTKGPLHLSQGGGGVTLVQGTVRALFYTKFTRQKGTFCL
jgi:hypothetical protein